MSQLSVSPWVHFLKLIGKIILLSWPMGLLLLALNPLFVIIENIQMSEGLWLGVSSSLVSAAKLWVLFVGALTVVPSVMFWSEVNVSRRRMKVR